jgi:hypothetical protein
MNGPHLRFRELVSSHTEWIAVHEDGRVFALRNHEMEIFEAGGRPLFGFLDRGGYRTCSLEAVEVEGEKALVFLSTRYGAETFRLELVPRISLAELGENIQISRLAAANRLAEAVNAAFPVAKLRRIFLNHPGGRFAQIVLDEGRSGERGIIADVSGSLSPERLISAALLWADRAGKSRKNKIRKFFILAGRGRLSGVRRLHACLSPEFSRKIGVLSLKTARDGEESEGPEFSVREMQPLAMADLWKGKPAKIAASSGTEPGVLAESVLGLDPDRIDCLFARNGITLRYLGLPFARFRAVKDGEKAWFGIERSRRILDDGSKEELSDLIAGLREYRKHDSPNKQHLYYQACHEAWLESILRRNIRKLDPGLILSPLYSQFRTSRDRIDLLALRRDGRLVIIELKVARDNGMVFQAVDYWRRIELQRRKGVLANARLFGDREIADSPAMIYLAAPGTCFTRQTDVLTSSVSAEIRILRFELGEGWKRELKVLKVEG